MIAVITKGNEKEIIKEFFELFKTPWEFYQVNRSYNVVICSGCYPSQNKAKLLIIYGNIINELDSENGIIIKTCKKNVILNYNDKKLPIYGETSIFESTSKPLITVNGTNEIVGMEISGKSQKILRIGFDLFQEINFLLSSGQPTDNSLIPTLDLHISFLRNCILNCGIRVFEIPPVPAGYDFITCLTHDVDFFKIRNHRFDHTMFGFIYRALFVSLSDFIKGRISWKKLLKNWRAVLALPGIYLGILQDFWSQFDHYIKAEKDLVSTFFIIPFKNWTGKNISDLKPKRRAVRYDINDITSELKQLKLYNDEIGVHGIDSWIDPEKGRAEFRRISSNTERSDIGIRIHWLYYNNKSAQLLEKAGFIYDSTLGYNDSVGYKSGTTQAFRPFTVQSLLEIPLNFQDTALFYPKRMNLTESQAFNLLEVLIKNVKFLGGIFTINWHFRSMVPERLWDDFYLRILKELKGHKVWISTVRDAVRWFNSRRAVSFEKVKFNNNKVTLKFNGYTIPSQIPGLLLRIYKPKTMEPSSEFKLNSKDNYIDFPLDKSELQVSF